MNNTIAFIVVLLIFRKFIIENRRGGQFLKVNLFIIIFMGAGYGRCPGSGRGGVTVDTGGAVTWTREGHCLHRHPREAGIPYGGRSGTSSLPWWNQQGDSSVAYAPSE